MHQFKRFGGALLALIFVLSLLSGCSGMSSETADAIGDIISVAANEILSDTADTEEAEAAPETDLPEADAEADEQAETLAEDGTYTSAEDVALYLHTYGHLPQNFITKNEAKSLGWNGGGLDEYADGMCIGGDRFGNYEGILPEASGREYHECDIDTLHANSRGAKRIVYSNDGLIYYTEDHYESFALLYCEE